MGNSKCEKYTKELVSFCESLIQSFKGENVENLLKLDHSLLKEVTAVILDKKKASQLLRILQRLGNAGKTSKNIRKMCGLENWIEDANENADVDEEETADSTHDIPVEPSKERKHFRVLMDVSNFLPKEVDVRVIEEYLVIHGKHEFLTDEHGIISREFTRKFEIPEDVDIETFRSLVDCYGVLTVEASFKSMKIKDKTLFILVDPHGETSLQPYDDLGLGFHELMEHQIQDGLGIRDIARNIAKQVPSDYIPWEAV